MLRFAWARGFAGVAAATCMGLGCNAIVGIHEGAPAITGLDSGSAPSGDSSPGGDVTVPVGDAGAGTDGTMPVGDAGSGADGTTPGDSGGDAAGPKSIPVSCTLSSATMVDDLGADDAGFGTTFNNQMWIVPGQEGDGVYVVTAANNQYSSFTLYRVSFQGQQTGVTQLGGNPYGNVRLLDVQPNSNGGESVLASYQDDAGLGGLQLVPLPTSLGANPPGPPVYLTPGFFPTMMAFPNGGTFQAIGTGQAWIVDIKDQNAGTQTVYSGGTGGPDAGPELLLTTTQQLNGSFPFVATKANLYAFIQGLGDGGASSNNSTVLSYPTSLDTPPTFSPVNSTSPFSIVVAAHPSAASPGDVLVQAVNVDFSGGSAQVFSATTPPSGLTALTIGSPPFTAGSSIPISDISFNASSQVWEGDQLLIAGGGGANPNDIMLMWIDPAGFASTHGLLTSRPNPIGATAIGANASPPVVEGFGSFFIAWTERLSGGGTHDQLWAAKVLCTASDH